MSTISITQTSPREAGPFEALVGFEGAGQYTVAMLPAMRIMLIR